MTGDKGLQRGKRVLGRGLSALIPQGDPARPAESGGVVEIPVDQIDASRYQARTHFDPRSLDELATSIRRYGILQPLVVRPADSGRYELVAGERRLRAARLARLSTVPAIVRDYSHDRQLEVGLVENVQRADLNPIEEARGYVQLMETLELSQDQAAERMGKSRPFIANKIRLLGLPEQVQEYLVQGRLSEGHARALLTLGDPEAIIAAATEVLEKQLTVRATESLARERTRKSPRNPKLDDDWEALRRTIESTLGTPVELSRTRTSGGKLSIRFFSNDQLEAILKRLGVPI